MAASLIKALRGTAALLISGALLAGCSTASDSSSESDSTGAVIETKFGEVDVPKNPQRVVALGWGDAETALALGVQPIGAADWLAFGGEGVGPWAEGLYEQSPEIIGTMEPEYEKIAALEPDLILDVKSSGDQQRYDRLSQIAPTVGVPEGGDTYLTSLDEQVEMISTALGKEAEGEKLLKDIDTQFEQATAAHPEFADKTVTVAAYTAEGWGAYIEESERVQFMENLGFELNPKIGELTPEGFTVSISDEQIGLLDADLLVTFPIYVPSAEITSQELYQNLPVVADGRAILLDEDAEDISSAFSLSSVLSIPFAIEQMVPKAAEVLK